MAKVRGTRIKTIKSKSERRDILTEMFEHFGIEVIDVGSQIPKTNKKK